VILPTSWERLIDRYHVECLDTERDFAIILPAVLEHGSLDDWDRLFEVYGWEVIAAWVADAAHRELLSPPMARFWSLLLLGSVATSSRWRGPTRVVPLDALPEWFPGELRGGGSVEP
jgi:hypothetical protein